MKGYWSRRIDDKHRLIYTVDAEGYMDVISCKGHYGDEKQVPLLKTLSGSLIRPVRKALHPAPRAD